MKHKSFYIFLGCEAIACMMLHFSRRALPQIFSSILAFPFEQTGILLRILSLSGSSGNLISIVFYSVICLVPVIILLLLSKKRRLYPEDALLAVLSAVLFAVIYYMINPGLLGKLFLMGQRVGKAMLGGIAYSVIAGYLLIRILRLFFTADNTRLQKYLLILLYIVNIIIVLIVFGVQFSNLLDSFEQLRADNKGNEHLLGASYVFLVLRYIVDAIPNLLIIPVVTSGQNLLSELSADRYSEQTAVCAVKLSRICGLALIITVLSTVGLNLLQLVFIRKLSVVSSSVNIPVFSVAFVLAALLLAQFIRENKQLKEDNDMFI
jgi:hypothetical protein